jgi:hypothetical protein
MKGFFFRKLLIKSITLVFSVLVWGQPALGYDHWQWDRTCKLEFEIGRMDDVVDKHPVRF